MKAKRTYNCELRAVDEYGNKQSLGTYDYVAQAIAAHSVKLVDGTWPDAHQAEIYEASGILHYYDAGQWHRAKGYHKS